MMLEALAFTLLAGLPASGPRMAPNDWQALVRRVGREGEYFEPSGDIGPRFELKRIRGPERAPHHADYIDLWGGLGPDRRFFPGFIRLVSEEWRPFSASDTQDSRTLERCAKETCLYIDQWIFTLGLDGSVMEVIHDGIVENPGMDVFGSLFFRPTESEAGEKLDSLLSFWQKP